VVKGDKIKFDEVGNDEFQTGFQRVSTTLSGFMKTMEYVGRTPDERGLSNQLAVGMAQAKMAFRFVRDLISTSLLT
jgi:hypothetical protein